MLVKTTDHFEPPIKMDGVAYSQAAFPHPFDVSAPLADEWLLYVIRGDGVVFKTAKPIGTVDLLMPGTVIGISGNDAHGFASVDYAADTPTISDWHEELLGTPHDPDTAIIAIGRIPQSSMPFLTMMGGFIRINPAEHPKVVARIDNIVDLIADEMRRDDAATGEIVLRLAEIITLEIGRVGRAQSILFSERPQDAEYDVRIWRAIVAISNEPEQRWTVQSMAQIAGMSRSAFAARDHETVGQTPLRSLRRLRMHRAAMKLTSPGTQVIAPLADATGYGSDAAFNRAFVKEFGYPPKRYSQKNSLGGAKGR